MRARRSEVIWDVDVSASSELGVEKGNQRMRIDEESRFGENVGGERGGESFGVEYYALKGGETRNA